MRDDYVVRLYKNGDGKRMNLLYNIVFRKQRNLKVWNWKFAQNSNGVENVISVAEEGGKIVAMYPSWSRSYKFSNRYVSTAQPVENCTHPDYRGWKLFKTLHGEYRRRCVELGVAFAFGFPTDRHFKLGKRLFGYETLFPMPILIKRLNLRLAFRNRFSNRILQRIVFLVSNKVYKILFLLSLAKRSKGFHIEQITTFDEVFDRFWEKISQAYNIIGVRNTPYLNWKFANKPGHKHTIFRCIKYGEVQGYIVLKISQGSLGERIGLILDLLGLDDNSVSELLNRAISYFFTREIDYIEISLLEDNPIYRNLAKKGFKKKGNPLNVVCELFDNTIDTGFLGDEANWFLTYGDTDLLD